jgi:peptidoglycan/LPS O-acetylase OafA/YrhL
MIIKQPKSVQRIREFEGLRGCLAWWVVIFHLFLHARVGPGAVPRILEVWVSYGWVAVELFIILSGFVIALLIDTQRESYGVFIVRRFFRLAPVYYVLVGYGVVEAVRSGLYGDRLRDHILLHLTILHGLVPDEILAGSANALCHPAWSVSVEWQFYLVAPFVLAFIRGSAIRALGLLIGCLAISYPLERFYTFPFAATVVMRAGLFGVGIASYYLYRYTMDHREVLKPLLSFLLPAGLAVVWMFNGALFSTGTLWVVIFSTVLGYHSGVESFVTAPLRRFLNLPFVVWLGKISYSTYLSHNIGLGLVTYALGDLFFRLSAWERILLLLGFGCPLILALSATLYYLIEKPGMRLGTSVSSRLTQTRARLPVVPLESVGVDEA